MTFLVENFNIIAMFVVGILFLFALSTVYEGKDKLTLKTVDDVKNGTSYSSDERMFLRYADMGFVKNRIPKKDSFEYRKVQDFLITSKAQKYRSVEIFYGAKVYYALTGFLVCLILGVLPVAFNFANTYLELGLMTLNFPVAFSIILPFLGLLLYKYPDSEISSENKKKKKKLQKEILSLGIVVLSMLDTGNSPYQILEVVKEIKPEFKEDIEKTLNEYYIDTAQALNNLKKRINIIDFDMIADSLLYAHESDNAYATKFLDDYLTRLEQAQKVIFQKSSKIRPYFLLAASTLPMIGALVVWFYPWLAEATTMLGAGFGM